MKLNKVVILIVSLFTASLARAQYYWSEPPGMGPYFRASAGPTFSQDSELKEFSVFGSSQPSAPISYDVGYTFNAAFGFAINRYVGFDFDTGYVWARVDNMPGYFSNGSSMANVPFLVNLNLSLPIPHTIIVPYIGGGGGGSVSIFDAHDLTNISSGAFVDGTASTTVFAYQAFAGVRFMVNPNFSLGVGYQFFATGNPTMNSNGISTGFQGVRTHTVLFTLQANF
jgi:opacity protein-like surface antigen